MSTNGSTSKNGKRPEMNKFCSVLLDLIVVLLCDPSGIVIEMNHLRKTPSLVDYDNIIIIM